MTHTLIGFRIVVEGARGEDKFSELLARMFALNPRVVPVGCVKKKTFKPHAEKETPKNWVYVPLSKFSSRYTSALIKPTVASNKIALEHRMMRTIPLTFLDWRL